MSLNVYVLFAPNHFVRIVCKTINVKFVTNVFVIEIVNDQKTQSCIDCVTKNFVKIVKLKLIRFVINIFVMIVLKNIQNAQFVLSKNQVTIVANVLPLNQNKVIFI